MVIVRWLFADVVVVFCCGVTLFVFVVIFLCRPKSGSVAVEKCQQWYITRRCSRQTKAQVFVKFTRHVSKRNMGSHPPNRLAGHVCAQLAQLDNLV